MEKSKQFEAVTVLAKKLIEELQLIETCDTLARWMIHHVSELTHLAETSPEEDKVEAEDRCRMAILDLWKQIHTHPGDVDVFASIPAIIKTITALNPDDRQYYYFTQAQEAADAAEVDEDTAKWLKVSRGIDYSARLLIEMSLRNAAQAAIDKDAAWIEAADSAFPNELLEPRVYRIIIGEEPDQDESTEQEVRLELLRDRRSRLESFLALSQVLIKEIDSEIEEVTLSFKD